MIGSAGYPLIATPARTVSDVMPSDRGHEPGRWRKKKGAGPRRLFEGSQRGDWRRVDREWLTRSTTCPRRWGRYRPSPSGQERRPVQPGSASSLAAGGVFVSQPDIDRHAVIDRTRGRDLAQVKRLGLRQAIEIPNEFLSVGHEPYHFAVLHVDILGFAVDDQCTHSRGCLGGLAQKVGAHRCSAGGQGRDGKGQYSNG